MKQNRASAHQEARLILQSGASADNIANTFDGNAFCPIDQLLSIKSRMVVRCPDQQQRRRQQECLLSRLYAMGSTYNGILQMSYVSMVFMLIAANWICAANANNEPINGVNGAADTSTSTEFDYENRGLKKFGDKCDSTQECGFHGSICDSKKRSCQCIEELPATNHIDKCGKESSVNESCFFNEQCEAFNFQTECRDGKCICRFEMSPIVNKDGTIECKVTRESREPERYVDPAMIGILAGMALMFVIICVVLRLFSRARWRENRTIFNTPNPRLMNVSLLRENKLMHNQERRGSRMSMRMPSRQPSMVSLRPHSPNPSIGRQGSRRGSRNNSYTSATSTRSNRSSNANQSNKGGHHHLDGKCRVPTTVLETANSAEPIINDVNHESIPITLTTNANASPISTSPNMVDL